VVSNLFANAVAYTPRGGAVAWRVEGGGQQAALVVTNDNDSLEPADLPQVFDRFWRKDTARTAGQAGQAGLGLSLARALTQLMGGQLSLSLARPDQVRAELLLPARSCCGHPRPPECPSRRSP
jgi:signal transduction histidine kinase